MVRHAVMKAIETVAENIADLEVFRLDIFSLPATRRCHRYGLEIRLGASEVRGTTTKQDI
jgi:hypothetical protein